uniref:Uncharacterized protein n=1 Tax=Thermosporothrix sp. COM3 TaxID=2490863 RepID=A0A455SPV3_9CHLR|nr:hypothetical protein KTC_29760 [Thermosporothrix sp. COM3]
MNKSENNCAYAANSPGSVLRDYSIKKAKIIARCEQAYSPRKAPSAADPGAREARSRGFDLV